MHMHLGWRDELYPVYGDDSRADNIAFVMERAATPLFGIPTFGVHVNGFSRDASTGEKKMWVARRALTKQTWPGVLDNCVCIHADTYFPMQDISDSFR